MLPMRARPYWSSTSQVSRYIHLLFKKVYSSLIIHNYLRGYILREEAFVMVTGMPTTSSQCKKKGKKRKEKSLDSNEGKTPFISSSITQQVSNTVSKIMAISHAAHAPAKVPAEFRWAKRSKRKTNQQPCPLLNAPCMLWYRTDIKGVGWGWGVSLHTWELPLTSECPVISLAGRGEKSQGNPTAAQVTAFLIPYGEKGLHLPGLCALQADQTRGGDQTRIWEITEVTMYVIFP